MNAWDTYPPMDCPTRIGLSNPSRERICSSINARSSKLQSSENGRDSPWEGGIPHQAPCPLGKAINLLIKQTMVSGKAGQEDKLRRFLIVFRHPVAQCPTIGFELALSHAYPPIVHQSKSARTLKDPRALCIVCDVRCITARCGRTSQAVRRRRRRRGNCNTWRPLPCARAVLRAFWPRPLRPSFPSPGPGRTR